MKICILGLGYIGLPTAAMFATHGHKIIGVDVNENIVDTINLAKIHIEEPFLDILVQGAVRSGNLIARTTPEEADVFIIAVPTPITENKKADMRYVISAAESIVPFLKEGNMVVLESTSPPGTVEKIIIPILKKCALEMGTQLFVAYSPERVLPGRILIELVENNRIIGGVNRKSAELVRDLYKTFVRGEIFFTDPATAETTKLIENTFRDVNIAFANELAIICENLGINVWEVIELANKHPRVNVHQPGPGVGGHCIAVDPWFLVEAQPELTTLIRTSRNINDSMPLYVYNKINSLLSIDTTREKKVITVLGLTYKPNVDDIRESPVIELINLLEKNKDYEIRILDPHIRECKYLYNNPEHAFADSDLVVLAVNHDVFKNLDYDKIYAQMGSKNILDLRNALDKGKMVKFGFNYSCLGWGTKSLSANNCTTH